MKILITGGAGFIGSHLCDRFIADGHYVICMDNLLTGSLKNISHLKKEKKFKFVKHNITEFIKVDGPVDAILHFASPWLLSSKIPKPPVITKPISARNNPIINPIKPHFPL